MWIDDEPDDARLLAAHVAGDPTAFATLVRRHQNRLWAVALRTLGNPDDAADALQDALLSAFRHAAGFRGNAAVTTWLHRIVVNACLDRARRQQARPTVPLPDSESLTTGENPDPYALHDTALAVHDALRQLPLEQRAAVVLVDIEGCPVAEAAGILNVAVGTVKSRCARGRARLAELLRQSSADPGNLQPTDTVITDDTLATLANASGPVPTDGSNDPSEQQTVRLAAQAPRSMGEQR